jgi:protease stability complex PrcB-like protein
MRRTRTARRCTCTSAILLLLAAGCGAAKHPLAYEDLTAKVGGLEFTHITVDVSRSRAELRTVLERNNPGVKIRLPPVDYSTHETFLVAAGPRSSTGYALRVVRVYEHGDHVQVVVRERTPTLGDPVHPRVTYPFRLISVPSHKSVHLKWLGRP